MTPTPYCGDLELLYSGWTLVVSQDRDNFVPADINNLNKLKQIMHICIIYLFILNLALFINYSTFSFFIVFLVREFVVLVKPRSLFVYVNITKSDGWQNVCLLF